MPTVSEGMSQDPAYDQPFIQDMRRALRADHPFDFLALMSSLVCVTVPRYQPTTLEPGGTTLDSLVDSFVGTDLAETTAALHVLTRLVPDELFAAKLRKVLASRRHPMPAFIAELDDTTVVRTEVMTHVLGDGDNYLIDLRLGGGERLSAIAYVDHNLGTVVKDAFFIPEDLTRVIAKYEELMDPDQSIDPVDPAVARAVVTQAIEDGTTMDPPFEGESWPQCRPLLEWVLRMLPAGGAVEERQTWTELQLNNLAMDFAVSTHARDLSDADLYLVGLFLRFGVDQGPGDPLRWTPVNVEILLMQWLPVLASQTGFDLERVPAVLRCWVRWCHEQLGLRQVNTDETLASVDHFELPSKLLLAQVPRQSRIDQISTWLSYGGPDELQMADIMLERVDAAVGGRPAALALDDRPLPDEPFDWSSIPDDVHGRVEEVLELTDRFCAEVLDVEHRTAVRRLLARSDAADPTIFRRRGKPERAAAALCWVICRANDTITSMGFSPGPLESQELLAWFGLSGSVSQRAHVFVQAIGVDPHHQFGSMDLGSVAYLVSERRRGLIQRRDRYLT